jgi:hypothetical protein
MKLRNLLYRFSDPDETRRTRLAFRLRERWDW